MIKLSVDKVVFFVILYTAVLGCVFHYTLQKAKVEVATAVRNDVLTNVQVMYPNKDMTYQREFEAIHGAFQFVVNKLFQLESRMNNIEADLSPPHHELKEKVTLIQQ
jgi:hypothetical protein